MFDLFKPKLVQFGDGKFGIQKFTLLDGNVYMWPKDYIQWCPRPYKYDTEEQALDEFYSNKVKVIATLDDEWEV